MDALTSYHGNFMPKQLAMSLDTKTATGVGNWVLTDLESRFSNVWKVKANARADKATAPHMRLCKRSGRMMVGKAMFRLPPSGMSRDELYISVGAASLQIEE